MSLPVSCPRCGGSVRPPDLMLSEWRCEGCGVIAPLHVAGQVTGEIMTSLRDRVRRFGDGGVVGAGLVGGAVHEALGGAFTGPGEAIPVWCPWPLPAGWMVTGVAWAGDDRRAPQATAVTLSGPAPLSTGPADVVFVAEELGVGLGGGLGGVPAADIGLTLQQAIAETAPHAKVRAGGHPTPLWAVPAGPGRSMYVGEARARWLYAIAWPPPAGYLLADGIVLHDLVDAVPGELVYGADSGRLRPVLTRAAAGSEP